MKYITYPRAAAVSSLLLFSVYSCTKEVSQQRIVPSESSISEIVTVIDLPGRTLAANCFQCHGTNGYGKDDMSLAGEPASEIISEINEMKHQSPGANIMNVHAQAYTDAEIQLIADFFSKQ